jgi:tripartite ATP-independent transporter DctM subunit
LMPGLLLAGIYITYILVRCTLNPAMGPPPPPELLNMPFRAKLSLLKGIALPLLIAFSVMGSIYLGVASVTESAAVGAVAVTLAVFLKGGLRLDMVRDAAWQTMSTCGMVMWLVLGTNALIGVFTIMGGIDFAKGLLTGLPFSPFVVLLIMMAVWIFLGFFIDWIGIMLLTMPIFIPAAKAFGFDLVWFGVLFNICMQVAYLSPPFAPAAFYLKGVAPKDMTLDEIFSAMWPFIGLQIIGLALVVWFPRIATWLPSLN